MNLKIYTLSVVHAFVYMIKAYFSVLCPSSPTTEQDSRVPIYLRVWYDKFHGLTFLPEEQSYQQPISQLFDYNDTLNRVLSV